MKLAVYLENEVLGDNYIVDEDSNTIFISNNLNGDLKKTYDNNKIYDIVRQDYREKGYFYDEDDLEKYNFENIKELVITIDNSVSLSNIAIFLENNSKYFDKVYVNISEARYHELDEILKVPNSEKILFTLGSNSRNITYHELKTTVETINKMVEGLDELSPLEQLMYLYDKVRDKVYADDKLNKEASRDVTSVLMGDKIVCLGYAQVFNLLVKKLGFNGNIERLTSIKNPKVGHARNIVYVNDPKYNLDDALLLFDLTFDAKQAECDDSFLESYRFFAKPIDFFRRMEIGRYSSSVLRFFDNMDYKNTVSNMNELDDFEKIGFITTIIGGYKLKNQSKNIVEYLNFSAFNIDKEKCMAACDEMYKSLTKKIAKEDFIKCLINVRKKQQEEDEKRYKSDLTSLSKTLYNTYKKTARTQEERLLLEVLSLSFSLDDALKLTEKTLAEKGKVKQKTKND